MHDHPKDVDPQRTKRQPDTDLPPAPRDVVGHHTIEANYREGGGQSVEYRRKAGNQPFRVERKANLFVNRTQVNHRNVRIQAADLFAHRLHDLSWVKPSAQVKGHVPKFDRLHIWQVKLNGSWIAQTLELHVFHHSDDFQVWHVLRDRLLVYKRNMQPNRIAAGEVLPSETLVNESHGPSFEGSNVAAGKNGHAEGLEQVRADPCTDRRLLLAGVRHVTLGDYGIAPAVAL